MDFALLAAYVLLPVAAYVRSRSLAWTVTAVAVAVSFAGALVSLAIDVDVVWTRGHLQVVLLGALLAVAVAAFLRPAYRLAPMRRQLLAIAVPVAILLAFFFVSMTFMTQAGAFNTPVGWLIGHSVAEDNAKWLDASAQIAAGGGIHQAVPMGGPLQLFMVFMATATGVMSRILLGGYNEVAVAANSVVYGQYLLAVIAPFALAPLAETRLRPADGGGRVRVPVPFLWVAGLVLVSANLIATVYGHLTFQFVVLICALWSATFLARLPMRHVRVLVTLSVAIAMVVWLPLNILAVVILVVVPVGLVVRGVRTRPHSLRSWDWVGLAAWLVAFVSLFEPIRSSLVYALGIPTAAEPVGGGAIRGVTAMAGVAASALSSVWADLSDSALFSAPGGTDQVGPILAILAAAAVLAAAVLLRRQPGRRRTDVYLRLLPIAALVGLALAITVLDFWVTGTGPHYGAQKFTFMAAVVVLATSLPLALLLIDPRAGGTMTATRWVAVAGVVVLLAVDTLVPRAVAAARPQLWSPDIPFDNPASYWWPAEVNGTGTQPISTNPIGCVYLPQGALVPSVVMLDENNSLQDPQRLYSCTRVLTGLGGNDTTAQPLVDWQRREWLTNQHAWEQSWQGLAAMPDDVLDKPLILLDAGTNVIGIESIRSLLARYPQNAGQSATASQ